MKICINIYGSQRDVNNTLDLVNNYIIDNNNEFYILYTGWDNEPKIYESMFQEIYVKRIKFDNEIINNYHNKYSEYKVIESYIPPKTLKYVLEGLYIKQKSIETIQSFILEKNINFDLIITVRSDTKITDKLENFYSTITENGLDKIYISNGYDYDVLN